MAMYSILGSKQVYVGMVIHRIYSLIYTNILQFSRQVSKGMQHLSLSNAPVVQLK